MAMGVNEAVLFEEEAAFFLWSLGGSGLLRKRNYIPFGRDLRYPDLRLGFLCGRLIWADLVRVQIYTGGDPPVGE